MPDKPMSPEETEHQRERLKHIALWLKHSALSQRELAHRIGVSEATISKWLSGSQALPLSAFVKLANAFGAKPYELLMPPDWQPDAAELLEVSELLLALPQEDRRRMLALFKAMLGAVIKPERE